MRLRLTREPSVNGRTYGSLFLEDAWQCFTLEDEVRERPGVSVDDWKISGTTAIPVGLYRVDFTMSQRFKRVLPVLFNVPGFSGVRIHSGNTIADTEGCILVGQHRSDTGLINSRLALDALIDKLAMHANDVVWISVEPPLPPSTTPEHRA